MLSHSGAVVHDLLQEGRCCTTERGKLPAQVAFLAALPTSPLGTMQQSNPFEDMETLLAEATSLPLLATNSSHLQRPLRDLGSLHQKASPTLR